MDYYEIKKQTCNYMCKRDKCPDQKIKPRKRRYPPRICGKIDRSQYFKRHGFPDPGVKNARENAALNEISNVEFFAGAAEEVVPAKYRESGGTLRSDVVVLDPPRKGCDEKLLQTVIQMEPKRIVYVSCDPATLARDLKYFGENGYALKRICPCDMFGHSYHVENVVLMSKTK